MKQEEKQLLLKDLCSRLPYHTVVHGEFPYSNGEKIVVDTKDEKLTISVIDWFENGIENIKPYLRPMSSMTEDEKIELTEMLDSEDVDEAGVYFSEGGTLEDYQSQISWKLCDIIITWLNAHHFDYRGLIEKGLALEAPEDMYDFNN